MNEQSNQSALNIAYESSMARLERANKRLFILLIISLAIIAGMLIYNSQFDTIKIEAEQQTEGSGNNYALGGDYYGNSEGYNPQEG